MSNLQLNDRPLRWHEHHRSQRVNSRYVGKASPFGESLLLRH
jgi:hypothetical protein